MQLAFRSPSAQIAASAPDPSHAAIHTILVVEDETLVRLPLTEYLGDFGYHVLEAADVAEARAVLNADTPIDLVFSDVNMPGGADGFALAAWIRQHRPDIKVLLTSAAAVSGKKYDGGQFMAKPYTLSSALQRIRNLLR